MITVFNSLLFPYDLSIHINVNPKLFKILLGFKISDICRLLRRMIKRLIFLLSRNMNLTRKFFAGSHVLAIPASDGRRTD